MSLQGLDVCINTSLRELGYAWIDGSYNGDIAIVYGNDMTEDCEYTQFGVAYLPASTDPYAEWGWIHCWDSVYTMVGLSKAEWDAQPLPYQVYDLMRYFGPENLFGTDYGGGMTYEQVLAWQGGAA